MGKLVVAEQILLNNMPTKTKPNTFLSGRFKCEQCPRSTTTSGFKNKTKQKVLLTRQQRLCKMEHLQFPTQQADVWDCPSTQPGCRSPSLWGPRGKVGGRSRSVDVRTAKKVGTFQENTFSL